jgi:hypothetical protein
MSRACKDLAVCQRIDCPDCDAFECELPCSPEPADGELYPWPRYPFAPGVIQGAKDSQWNGLGESDAYPLTTGEGLKVLLLVLLVAVLGSVLGGFLAGYLPWPAWLTVGLPG